MNSSPAPVPWLCYYTKERNYSMKFLSRLFSAALLLTVVCLNTSPAGESIRGTRSPQKIYPRDLSSIMKLHTLTDQEAALQALNPPKLPPDIGEFPEAEFEKMKDAPKPEFDGHGTLTIDRSGGISGLPSVTGAPRSEEHTSELQSHSFISYAVFCLKKK